jgi:hypothetical protein
MVELAKPCKYYCDGIHYHVKDIAAEREEWQKVVANADKSGYARALGDVKTILDKMIKAHRTKAFPWFLVEFNAMCDKALTEIARAAKAEARVRELEAKTGFQRETRQRLKR